MKFRLVSLGALVLCVSVTAYFAAGVGVSPTTVAGQFVDALQHQHFGEAAAMFAPDETRDTAATERNLKKVSESLGGFSAMRPTPTLPAGKSVKLEVSPHGTGVPKNLEFVQVRYTSTASDGKPVFYEVNLTADRTLPRVLSFGVHFPTADAQSTHREDEPARRIIR